MENLKANVLKDPLLDRKQVVIGGALFLLANN